MTTYIFLTVLLCQGRLTQLEVLKSQPLKVLKPYDLGVWQGFALRATLPQCPKATNTQRAQAEDHRKRCLF